MLITVLLCSAGLGLVAGFLLVGLSDFSMALASLVFAVIFGLHEPRHLSTSERVAIGILGFIAGALVGAIVGWGGYALVEAIFL